MAKLHYIFKQVETSPYLNIIFLLLTPPIQLQLHTWCIEIRDKCKWSSMFMSCIKPPYQVHTTYIRYFLLWLELYYFSTSSPISSITIIKHIIYEVEYLMNGIILLTYLMLFQISFFYYANMVWQISCSQWTLSSCQYT